MKNMLNWKTFLLVAVLLVAGSVVYANYAANKANEGVEMAAHIKGNPEATVTLTEYSDFQCPACAQFYPVVSGIVEEYGDSVKLEYRHFPLITIHPFAVPAAKAAEAAGQQGKFWEMHDKLFENQTTWSSAVNPRAYFDQYAEEIGLDVALFKQHYKASVIEDHVKSHYEEARELGLSGTPSFLLNGERMEFGTFEEFILQIESAIGVNSGDAVDTEEGEETADAETTEANNAVFGF